MAFNAAQNLLVANLPRVTAAAEGIKDTRQRTNILAENSAFDRADRARRTDLDARNTESQIATRAEQLRMQRDAVTRAVSEHAQQQTLQDNLADLQDLNNLSLSLRNGPDEAVFRQTLQLLSADGEPVNPNMEFSEENWQRIETMVEGSRRALLDVTRQPDPLLEPKPEPEVPASVQALQWRAQEAGLQPGTPEYRQFIQSGGKMPEGFAVTLPDGTQVAQGNIGNMKFTEGQAKDNVFVTRAEGALSLLDSVGAGALTSRLDRGLDAVPFGLARGAQSEDFQVAQQSGDEFLQAILRKDTGAAITEGEQELYGKTYLPQPGDGARVIEAKRQSRIRAVEALKSGMNMQQLTVSERANVEAARRAEATKPAGAQDPAGNSNIPPAPEAVEILKSNPTDEYKRFFDEVFGAGAAERALSQ